MTAYNFTAVLILAMISARHCMPIEVVYTGDGCDCPKSLNYRVNMPPPPESKENPRCEHGYKLDVPVQAKAKVTYSFDFTVQEPTTPPPVEEEKLNLYAKVDRITAHKKDCIATTERRSPSCECGDKCDCSRNSRCRYVSPVERAVRSSLPNREHPNSVSKRQRRRPAATALAWAAIIKPLNDQTPFGVASLLKSRRRRDLSRIFGLNPKPPIAKRSERVVKQYNTRLQEALTPTPSPTLRPLFGPHFKPFQHFPTIPYGKGPLGKLRELMLTHRSRNKRDIKGEYDLLEKERDQLDLTLPEIIQFMPETLDPNFKRGQCQFVHCQQLQQQAQEELLHRIESNKIADQTTTKSSLATADTEVSTEHSEGAADADADANDNSGDNDISSSTSSLKKRNADHYGFSHIQQHFTSPAPPGQSYYIQSYDLSSDIIPRPFAITRSLYGPDPTPQHYVGAPPSLPPQIYDNPGAPVALPRSMNDEAHFVGGPIYNPVSGYYTNPNLDRVIADIVSQHLDFLEAGAHKGGALVDPAPIQDQHTKSFLKLLAEGRFHTLFGEDDRTYSYAPALSPLDYHLYPPSYASSSYH